MGPAPPSAALVGPGAVPPGEGAVVDRVVMVTSTVRCRSRQAVSRPKAVQFSLTEEEFEEVSEAAARSGLARGAFAADVTLAAARGTQSRLGRWCVRLWWSSWPRPDWCGESVRI